ncbi:Nitrogen regulation protein NR(II) [Methylophaga frappieri]|uniref:Sensory histidine kinase/phosphatase NtrB n=1 Tax=Methylophaga frappieri (strain ATCC BAA-2434 / DSM 25690 / JAM7) TaxID=754477 RepID=I1YFR2_METFJ|nr:nitrogen regulation protein NR(II) [Methylophaga frappieri]AFJ01755.1 Nitrogen regulation protein NR(II) [Methylophaga frappieri]
MKSDHLLMNDELIACTDVLENLATAVLVLDTQCRVCYINTATEIMFEISQRQAEHIPFQMLLPGELRLQKSIQRVLSSGQALIEREITLFLPASGEIVVDCAIKLMDLGESYLLIELSQLDYQQRVNRDENLQTQQQVVRGLAHEIKNPLGGLRGAAQLLERQLDSDDLKEYTRIIISEADRLQNLMTRMLGPYQQSDKTAVNIHEILQRVRQLVDIEVDERLQFIVDYDPSIPDLHADFDQLIQIFLNIVRNAVQAMHGIGIIRLRTRIQRNLTIDKSFYKLGVLAEVEDNGPGIPKHLQDSLFYPLVTGRADGTGLGLYLVQNLVQRNDGTVICSSHPGQTVFSVTFPLESS